MANTLSTSAVAKTLSRKGTTVLQSTLAPLSAIATVIKIEQPYESALSSEVPLVTVPATTQTDPTSFESGDCTITTASLAHHLYAQSFHVSASDMNSGLTLEWLADANARAFANKLWDVAAAVLTTANYGAAAVSVTSANFALADFETLAGGISSPGRAVVLNTGYFVKVKPTWLPMGNCTVYEANRWSTAGTKVNGLVADPRAIVCRTGIPMTYQTHIVERELIVLPQIGLMVELALWVNTATRAYWASYSSYFASAVGDANALKLLVTP